MLNYLLLFIDQFIAASTPVVAKSLAATIDPTLSLLLRGMVSALVYAIIILVLRKKIPHISPKDWWTFLLLGILCIPMNQLLFFVACKYTSAPNVALAYAMIPAFVLVMEIVFLKVKASKLKIFGIAVAVIGAIVIFSEGGIDLGSEKFWGNVLAILAAMSWAVYTVVGKKTVAKFGPFVTTGMAILFGFAVFCIIFSFIGDFSTAPAVDAWAWSKIVYLAVGLSVIGYSLWAFVLKRLDASKVAVFTNLQPIITPILSAIFLSFVFTPQFVIGSVVIIAGVIFTQKG